jgi:hypothetical protein
MAAAGREQDNVTERQKGDILVFLKSRMSSFCFPDSKIKMLLIEPLAEKTPEWFGK